MGRWSCAAWRKNSSHYVIVYVLLDKFKAYSPLVVVKGTPKGICKYREKYEHIRHQTGWHVWRFSHETFWELPSRHSADKAAMMDKFPDVDSEHWGKKVLEQ